MSLTILFICFAVSKAYVINNNDTVIISEEISDKENGLEDNTSDVFNGVYTECFLYLSYSCLQKKTLLYLKELNKLSEVSVIGEYVKFVKVNETEVEDADAQTKDHEELSFEIDRAVDRFFNSHILKFSALGKEVSTEHTVEEFVGRKRKGGGGGGGGHHGGGDDGGKKKMMMMAMMCMKMKLMMMVPAMMGMMGMMSFKGMMFSMMSFMISKMMLLMKILEKKGGGGGGSGGADGGWAAGGGGGGGAWMPAGGQDYGGGGGGGYDANGQWQSRSIAEDTQEILGDQHQPIVSYVPPLVRFNNRINSRKPYSTIKSLNDEVVKLNQRKDEPKSRKKRGILDLLQNAYVYWLNQVLGAHRSKKLQPKLPKFRIVNGMKYVYYPVKYVPQIQKQKSPRELSNEDVTKETPIITAEDLIKGEIVEGPVESRMNKKKFNTMKNDLNEVIEENPWE